MTALPHQARATLGYDEWGDRAIERELPPRSIGEEVPARGTGGRHGLELAAAAVAVQHAPTPGGPRQSVAVASSMVLQATHQRLPRDDVGQGLLELAKNSPETRPESLTSFRATNPRPEC